jgi:hypothetical protein
MKKGLSLLLTILILLSGLVVANAERSEMELMTLEGTYQVSVTITNSDIANHHLESYGVEGTLPPDIAQREFKVDVKSKDGKYLLFDKGEELENTGLARNKEYFIFNFKYEVKDSSMQNIMYEIKADLLFNDSTQSFDTINPKGKASLIYHHNDGYSYIGVGDFTMEKIAGKAKEENSNADTVNSILEEREIPRGITFVKGIVEVKRAGTDNWIRARRNMPLNPGDTVRTGKNSYADLGCSSGEFTQATGSDIMLRPLSTITVPDKTLKVEKKSKVRVAVDDAMKKVYSLFGKEEFEVETPSAVCGIRGTDFIVDVDENGNTTFLLSEGEITVKSKFDNTEVTLITGQKIFSSVNKALSEPEELTNEDKEAFSADYEDIQEETQVNDGNKTLEEDTQDKKDGIGFFGKLLVAIIILMVLFILFRKRTKK